MKKVLSLLLCVTMISSFSVEAFAATTEASVVITKTVEDIPEPSDGGGHVGNDGGDDDPVNTPSYEVSIPTGFSLDTGDYFEVGVSSLSLNDQQELHIDVDYDRTFAADGYFYLKNDANVMQQLPCSLYRGYSSGVYWDLLDSAEKCTVATFTKRGGLLPDTFGAVRVVTSGRPSTAGFQSIAGTYSGTIYFTIEIIDF